MSDDLRTRITKALSPYRYGHSFTSPEAVDYARVDAVIEALGLQPPGLQLDGTFIDPTGIVWRHTGSEWTDDLNYRP